MRVGLGIPPIRLLIDLCTDIVHQARKRLLGVEKSVRPMMRAGLWISLLLVMTGCYQRQDPVVQAAQDLQRMAYDFAAQEDERMHRINTLRLGMLDSEVIDAIGPPSTRRSIETGAEASREVWTYHGALRPLATLTFVNQRLTEIRTE